MCSSFSHLDGVTGYCFRRPNTLVVLFCFHVRCFVRWLKKEDRLGVFPSKLFFAWGRLMKNCEKFILLGMELFEWEPGLSGVLLKVIFPIKCRIFGPIANIPLCSGCECFVQNVGKLQLSGAEADWEKRGFLSSVGFVLTTIQQWKGKSW